MNPWEGNPPRPRQPRPTSERPRLTPGAYVAAILLLAYAAFLAVRELLGGAQ